MRSFTTLIIFVLILGALPVFPQNYAVNSNSNPADCYPNANTNSYRRSDCPAAKVRGKLFYEDNGKPVRRAEVELIRAENIDPGAEYTTITDDEGNFEFDRVAADTYFVATDLPGILTPGNFSEPYRLTRSGDSKKSKLDNFFTKIVTDGINEREVFATVKRAAIISGRITYADGDPAPGIRIEAMKLGLFGFQLSERYVGDRPGRSDWTTTDDRGYYRFTNLPPGKYVVLLREKAVHRVENRYSGEYSDRSELKTYFPNSPSLDNASVIELVAGTRHEETDIVIPDRKLYRLTGTVISKIDRKPVQGARLSFSNKSGEKNVAFSPEFRIDEIWTDENGMWAIKDLPAGEYSVLVRPPHENRERAGTDGKKARKLSGTILEIKVVEAETENIITEMPADFGIFGNIYIEGGKPLPANMFLYAEPADGEPFLYPSDSLESSQPENSKGTRSDKKIPFRIGGLPAGRYTIRVDNNDNPYRVKSVRSPAGNSIISVRENEDESGVEVILTDKIGVVKGSIKGAFDPEKLSRVFFMPVNDRSEWDATVANGAGNFEFSVLPGEYYVFLYTSETYQTASSAEDIKKLIIENGVKVAVKEGETTKLTLDAPKK